MLAIAPFEAITSAADGGMPCRVVGIYHDDVGLPKFVVIEEGPEDDAVHVSFVSSVKPNADAPRNQRRAPALVAVDMAIGRITR
jgi:hypothetical protein